MSKTLAGVITSWNAGAERLYGYSAGSHWTADGYTNAPGAPDELPAILAHLRRGERLQHSETVRMRKDGQRLDVSLSIFPIKDANGRIIGAATIARDITERMQVEAYLKASLQEKRCYSRRFTTGSKTTCRSCPAFSACRQMITDPSSACPSRRVKRAFKQWRLFTNNCTDPGLWPRSILPNTSGTWRRGGPVVTGWSGASSSGDQR